MKMVVDYGGIRVRDDAIVKSRFTLPPAATFTPAPNDLPGVSHQSKNGITAMDNGLMRDGIDAYDIVWDMGLGTNKRAFRLSAFQWAGPI